MSQVLDTAVQSDFRTSDNNFVILILQKYQIKFIILKVQQSVIEHWPNNQEIITTFE